MEEYENMLLNQSDIDAVILGSKTDYPAPVMQMIDKQTRVFVDDMLGKLRERMIDLRNGRAVFVGGGSILLKKYIESSDRVYNPIFVDDIAANARGYELLYKAYRKDR